MHIYKARIYYEDTDAAGIVYYANYLKFAERARTEFLRSIGYENSGLAREFDSSIVVRSCSMDLKHPARLDDLITVKTELVSVSGASVQMRQSIVQDATALVIVDVKLACMNWQGKATRFPDLVRASFIELLPT